MAAVGSGRVSGSGASSTIHPAKQHGVDSHLRSARVVKGYKVEASDGAIGEIADFLIDGRTWVIREIEVESGHWLWKKDMHTYEESFPNQLRRIGCLPKLREGGDNGSGQGVRVDRAIAAQ